LRFKVEREGKANKKKENRRKSNKKETIIKDILGCLISSRVF